MLNPGNLLWAVGLSLALPAVAVSQTRVETDFQVWNDTQVILPLNKSQDWNFALWAFGRLGNDVRAVTDARIGGLITRKVTKHVTLGDGYLYRDSNPTFVRRRSSTSARMRRATAPVREP